MYNYDIEETEDFKEYKKIARRKNLIKSLALYLAIVSCATYAVHTKNKEHDQICEYVNNTKYYLENNSNLDNLLTGMNDLDEGIYKDGEIFYDVKYCPYSFDGENYYFDVEPGYYLYGFYLIKKINSSELTDDYKVINVEQIMSLNKIL